jgi:hypothetical protein
LITVANRIDFSLYGLKPWGYHLSNLLFHIANCLLLWLLVLRLGFSPLVAFLTAALVAVHPINVQDMVMVTGRCGLLGLLFSLLTLLLLFRSEPWGLTAMGVAYTLALLSKESALVIPGLFLAVAWFTRFWTSRQIAMRIFLLAGLSLLYLACRPSVGSLWPTAVSRSLWALFIVHKFVDVVLFYAGLTLAPILLYTDRGLPSFPVLGWIMTVAGILFTVWVWRRPSRWPFFSWVWVVLSFLPPTVLMVSRSLLYDHWAYPALLGFLLPIAIALAHGFESTRPEIRTATRWGTGLLLLSWIGLSQWNTYLRRSDQAFYRWSACFSAADTMKKNLANVDGSVGKS